MDFDNNNEQFEGVTKWPFYFASLFIVVLVVGLAFTQFQVNGLLDTWQLITCALASGLASILVFIPHLVDNFLTTALDPDKFKNQELERKTYFDIKEMRTELEAISVKIDKVPTLVDKIVKEAGKDNEKNNETSQLSIQIESSYSSLSEKIKLIEELIIQPPLLPESSQENGGLEKEINSLKKTLDSLVIKIDDLCKVVDIPNLSLEREPVIEEDNISENDDNSESNSNEQSNSENLLTEEIADVLEPDETQDSQPDEISEDEMLMEKQTELIDVAPGNELNMELTDPVIKKNLATELEIDDGSNLNLSEDSNQIDNEESEVEPNSKDSVSTDEQVSEEFEEERFLTESSSSDLPDPAETIRKVDAILQETNPEKTVGIENDKIEDKESPRKLNTGSTSVVANVMIGIGNKPYLRGEGPGLSWDEGVPMNFIEIGKWSWSPPQKNASLTVQLYRNDEDPDQSGKIKVKAGEKIEITPNF